MELGADSEIDVPTVHFIALGGPFDSLKNKKTGPPRLSTKIDSYLLVVRLSAIS